MEPLRTSKTPSFGLKPILDFVDFFGTFSEKYFSQWPRMADLAEKGAGFGGKGGRIGWDWVWPGFDYMNRRNLVVLGAGGR